MSRWYYLLTALILLAIVDLLQVIYPRIVKRAIEYIQAMKPASDVIKVAILMVVVMVGVASLRLAYRWFLRKVAIDYDYKLRMDLMDKYLAMSERDMARYDIGDLMARLIRDTRLVRRFIMMGSIVMVDLTILGGMAIFSMALLNLKLTIYTVLPLMILTVFVLVVGRFLFRMFERIQKIFGEMTERVRETATGIKVIKTFVREDYWESMFDEITDRYLTTGVRVFTITGSFWPLSAVIVGLSQVILLWVGGNMVMNKVIDLGTLVSFFLYINLLSWPMLSVGFLVNLVSSARAGMRRIEEILTYEVEVKDLPGAMPLEDIRDVSVRDLKDDVVLKGISFDVRGGEVLGITGPPGSGKSVLLKYLIRLWDPPEGSVLINGRDIRLYTLESLRRLVAYVPQEPILFAGTVRDNIAFAKPDATDEEIIWAAKMACVWEDIQGFPNGLDTVVGERGITLSGGQRQRISIARALLAGRRYLVFDDPLSAVDTHTERCIVSNLKEYVRTSDVLLIMVSHRIPAIHWADRVLVLEDGRMLEYGKPEELAKAGGLYSKLYAYQLGGEGL